ncbi:uncharacterized protein LOC111406444 [Olea europaea var. sylvestris]|uniref:uncharacterized protein LOC111406444 n=1 Tax=Olea europaea var. sylvestris TaxID=158386 RepID=UPI000C1D7440|nr:uncharacterized protein LOC111406444 [Olea europaea var. sylvestris]
MAHPHDDALVIVGDIADFDVKRALVDGESATNVLIWDAFLGLKVPPDKLKIVNTPLQGFGGATVIPEGTVELPITLGTYPTTMVIVASFLVVNTPMAYNAIYGQPLLNATRAISSTYHQVLKFPTSKGVGAGRSASGSSWTLKKKWKLVRYLTDNLDVFAWSLSDITGVSPALAQHCLGVLLGAKPVKQKKRNLALERQEIARAEVEKLLQVGFI